MKILVTGASGFVGGYAVRALLNHGHEVIALSRSSPSNSAESHSDVERLQCDLAVNGALNLDGLGIEAVVHLAASLSGSEKEQSRSTLRGTENLLAAMKRAGVRDLVGISSIAVLDYAAAAPMSVIDESSPLCTNERAMGVYASTKAKQEALFAAFGAEPGNRCVILRPGLVYDETRLVNAHAGIVKGPLCLLAKHGGEVPVVTAAGVADAIVSAAEKTFASGQLIHLIDDALPGQPAYLAGLRRRGLLPEGGIEVPWRLLAGLASAGYATASVVGLRRRLPEALLPQSFAARMKPFRYSSARARQLLGLAPAARFS